MAALPCASMASRGKTAAAAESFLKFRVDSSLHSAVLSFRSAMAVPLHLDMEVGEVYGAGDSAYFAEVWSAAESDRLLAALQAELVYVPRSSMTFSIFGKTFELPRDKSFLGDVAADGSYPLYRYGGTVYPLVQPWTETTRAIRDALAAATGVRANALVANRYRQGSDFIGLHRDKTRDIAAGTPVLTVSFGARRRFVLKSADGETESVELGHGSLFVLGAETNAPGAWKHSIAKTSTAVGERISLTYRCIKTRFVPATGQVIEAAE